MIHSVTHSLVFAPSSVSPFPLNFLMASSPAAGGVAAEEATCDPAAGAAWGVPHILRRELEV